MSSPRFPIPQEKHSWNRLTAAVRLIFNEGR
jgi:hypothetical protein